MSRTPSQPIPRGRPKDPAKREALLDAARELFLAYGPEVTTEAIAEKAGVAKATLYANFPDKGTLIEAVLRRESNRTMSAEQFEASQMMEIEEALVTFGAQFLAFVNDRQLSRWDRLIILAAEKHPEMPQRFFDAGPGRGQAFLESIVSRGIVQGRIAAEDVREAASDLTGLWLGFVSLELNLRVREPLQSDEIQARAERGVQLFMRIYGKTKTGAKRKA